MAALSPIYSLVNSAAPVKEGGKRDLSDVSTNGTVQVELIREGFWHIVTTKEWR
jgi:hypothetical protein